MKTMLQVSCPHCGKPALTLRGYRQRKQSPYARANKPLNTVFSVARPKPKEFKPHLGVDALKQWLQDWASPHKLSDKAIASGFNGEDVKRQITAMNDAGLLESMPHANGAGFCYRLRPAGSAAPVPAPTDSAEDMDSPPKC